MVGVAGVTAIELRMGVTVMLSALVALLAGMLASLTCTVKLDVPAVAGVPEIAPLALFRVNPAGSDPPLMDQLYGVLPPLAVKVVA